MTPEQTITALWRALLDARAGRPQFRPLPLASRVIACSTMSRAALLAMRRPPSRQRSSGAFWLGVCAGLAVSGLALVMETMVR